MRLSVKYNRTTLLITIPLILIAGIVYYLSISYILTDQVTHLLNSEEKEIYDYVDINHHLPQVFETNTQKIVLTPVKDDHIERRFTDTPFYNKKQGNYEAGRALISSIKVNGQNYKIQILESKVETEDLIQAIFAITLGLILVLILVLLITNRLILNRLWKPFYDTLSKIQLFNLKDMPAVEAANTDIDEFRELNEAVNKMSLKVKTDYEDLKAFTENAAHELLTPVAIINSKLDTLIQNTELSEKQSKLVSDMYQTVTRMTRLNKSLLLLVKVENKLIKDTQPVDLKKMITEMVDQFEELFHDKELVVNCRLDKNVIEASYYLMEILINNLLINAIRHNYLGGMVNIKLTANSLRVQNTGDDKALNNEDIFKRFNKSSDSEGSGLGLTICRQICQTSGFDLTYSFTASLHTFNINFSKR